MDQETVRTTLTLPKDLLEATDKAVQAGKARSRNEFVTRALRRELAVQKRAEIDAALAEMANDLEYQREVLQMEAEFAPTQWEALKLEETSE
ncbi:MAG: ribbon-helix-helix domain-containing protein [Nostoc sp.]|uniref:ribbon-helix-helix domain-containing protein n=1 Tax=unclassified Nostoc TaxID=2593658 RepID=UPI0025FC1638|nr:ribbon-helix-helix domain-containing protein [Nostoc sp. NOS(2021)]MBN3898895.1 ribbon-helix-helix protein, CopG family [Nostoc sp. NOS(2021)]